jgi:hypothetical protein
MTHRWQHVLRYLWAAPATLAGLVPAALACAMGASARVTDGVLEVAGGRLGRWVDATPARFKFIAITFGHVVIGQSHAALAELRPHEHEHVRQYERWGALFFVVYLGSSGAQWLCGRDPYRHNRFERLAQAAQTAAQLAAQQTAALAPHRPPPLAGNAHI